MSAQLSVEQQERQITSAISLPITPRRYRIPNAYHSS